MANKTRKPTAKKLRARRKDGTLYLFDADKAKRAPRKNPRVTSVDAIRGHHSNGDLIDTHTCIMVLARENKMLHGKFMKMERSVDKIVSQLLAIVGDHP